MLTSKGHRKVIQHDNVPKVSHELTWSCYEKRLLLTDPTRRDLVMDAIRRSTQRLGYATLAFVIMPHHVHLLVRHPGDEHDISELLYAVKKPSSFQIKQLMIARRDPEYESLSGIL